MLRQFNFQWPQLGNFAKVRPEVVPGPRSRKNAYAPAVSPTVDVRLDFLGRDGRGRNAFCGVPLLLVLRFLLAPFEAPEDPGRRESDGDGQAARTSADRWTNRSRA